MKPKRKPADVPDKLTPFLALWGELPNPPVLHSACNAEALGAPVCDMVQIESRVGIDIAPNAWCLEKHLRMAAAGWLLVPLHYHDAKNLRTVERVAAVVASRM